MRKRMWGSAAGLFLLAAVSMAAADAPKKPAWVQRSDEDAKVLVNVLARFAPEAASSFGAEGFDDQISDLTPGYDKRFRAAAIEARDQLKTMLAGEKDPAVRQDLEIMIKSADDALRGAELQEKYHVQYFNLSRLVFFGMRSLLDDQVPQERRQLALVRLKRYAGTMPNTQPITVLAEARTREHMQLGLLGPGKAELEKDLANSGFFIDGIGKLFAKYKIEGYEEPYARLKEQLAAYNEFLKKEVQPRARDDFRLPREEYEQQLTQFGVDMPPEDLISTAHAAFDDIQKQMQALAPEVAKMHGIQATDYRDVIRGLKKDQLVGDAILAHYQERLAEIEKIIVREHLVSLPERHARIRLASAAEAANTPAPNMHPPRLIGNTGEVAEFVLPLTIPAAPGSKEQTKKFDDFTFKAASWTLTAHEARPGHELQFDSMLEKGVSNARAVFAFNSANIEGWGLYAEWVLYPYMPKDGQLISLQHRLMRSARMFLDPEVQLGKTTPEKAKAILMNDVVLSDAMAQQEIERYMFWAPGQATAYYYGYTKLLGLRKDVEKTLGSKFNAQRFHDFILAQGFLPPNLLRKAVMEDFVKQELATGTNAAQ